MSVGRGSGKTFTPTVVGVVRLWGVRLALGYFLSNQLGWGTVGVWLAMALSNYFSGLVMYGWVHRGSWAVPLFRHQEKIMLHGMGNRALNR
jgi:Na+-driven multidrug efflux pump